MTDKVIGTKTNSLGEKNFKLASAAASDKWGRPATKWTYTTGDKATTFVEKPDVTYTVATTECDIAHDISLKDNKEFTLYTNGSVNGSKYVVQPLDTVQKLGAQGTLLEVYKDAKVIVAIDTFLAKVTDVKEATYDPQGHLKAPAMITLTVYSTAAGETVVLTDKDANYGYAKGDYVLVNAYTNNTVNNTTGVVTVNTVKAPPLLLLPMAARMSLTTLRSSARLTASRAHRPSSGTTTSSTPSKAPTMTMPSGSSLIRPVPRPPSTSGTSTAMTT